MQYFRIPRAPPKDVVTMAIELKLEMKFHVEIQSKPEKCDSLLFIAVARQNIACFSYRLEWHFVATHRIELRVFILCKFDFWLMAKQFIGK